MLSYDSMADGYGQLGYQLLNSITTRASHSAYPEQKERDRDDRGKDQKKKEGEPPGLGCSTAGLFTSWSSVEVRKAKKLRASRAKVSGQQCEFGKRHWDRRSGTFLRRN